MFSSKIFLEPIGFVKTKAVDKEVRNKNVVSKIILRNEYIEALEGLEEIDFHGLDIVDNILYGRSCRPYIYRRIGGNQPWQKINLRVGPALNLAGRDDTLFYNHTAVYRSADYGENWDQLDGLLADEIHVTEKSVYSLYHIYNQEKVLLK